MRFSRFRLENWRNFDKIDLELQDRAFLVGPNASGKSNLLDAFRFLRDIASPGGIKKAIDDREGVSKIRSLSARKASNIIFDIELEGDKTEIWRYYLAFSQDNLRRPEIKEEKVYKCNNRILNRPDKDDLEDKERLRQTHLEQTIANRAFRPIVEFLASISYFHLVPQLIRNAGRFLDTQNDPFGGEFLENIAKKNKKTQESWLGKIEKALQIAVPQLEEFKLGRDDKGFPHIQAKYKHWRLRGAFQDEKQFSDGTLRLIGLLWSILDGTGPLLLEEPELSLHSRIIRYIPQIISRTQKKGSRHKRQIFLSTHSLDIFYDKGIAPEEVFLLLPKLEGTEVKDLSRIEEIKALLEDGLELPDILPPYTGPIDAEQLPLTFK